MRKKHPPATLRELIQSDACKNSEEFNVLRSRIRRLTPKDDPQIIGRVYEECSNALSGGAGTISITKGVQWRIVNYSLLLDAAIVSGLILLAGLPQSWQIIYSSIGVAIAFLLAIFATRMIKKTDSDLDYYRASVGMYEILRNDITNVQLAVESNVLLKHAKMKPKADRFKSIKENKSVFSHVFYAALWGGWLVTTLILLFKSIIN